MEETINCEIARILEQWAMMIVEPVASETSIFSSEEPVFHAKIDFAGVVNGTYTVICQQSFASTLVANLLGNEPNNDDRSAAFDALAEMTNVMSGNLLTTCYGTDTVFGLSSPEVKEVSWEELCHFFNSQTFSFLADDAPVSFAFSLSM